MGRGCGWLTVFDGRQDEGSLVAGTSEGTVVQFQFVSSVLGQDKQDWFRTRTFKNHSHDVRALVHLDSAVVSGGPSVCPFVCLPPETQTLTPVPPPQVWTPSWSSAPCWTKWRSAARSQRCAGSRSHT